MPDKIRFEYEFRFADGRRVEIPLLLNGKTLAIERERELKSAAWTELGCERCSVCPLDPLQHAHCPVARHMYEIIDIFQHSNSCEILEIEVRDGYRCYTQQTSLQSALGSLMGIVMVSSGCPVMEPLRPLVRFHLPFSSMEESEFRIVSMYLMAQYLRVKHGKTPDWTLCGLEEAYEKISVVNRFFARRLRQATTRDASINALVALDSFAKGVPFAVRTALNDFEGYFESYLRS